jgi:putative heme-binding domain-containing protein
MAARGLITVVTLLVGGTPARALGPDFHVPPGFVVERVAAAPLVKYPLFAAFDDLGRLFVAEGTGTNLSGEELRAQKLGRIVLLEDRDGDGVFDDSRVFADGLVFPQGVLWHDGALYTASHPSFWRLEDAEGQGRATRRVELLTGFGFNGNGCDIHGPFLGPDGRLYWTDGRHGYKVTTRDSERLEGLAARVWRCRPDGTDVERVCGGGFDNPVEIAFTAEGEAIGTMDQGQGDCLLHYVDGGVYPMEHPCLAEFPTTGPFLGAVRQYSPVLPAALCGLLRYRSGVFGSEYQGAFFSTHYMVHKVVRHELVREGSTFRALDADFLTTTAHDVRLTDVVEDADGSLLVVDMGAWYTYGFPGNPPPKPDALGAIYRVKRAGAPTFADPRGKALNIAGRSPAELASLLDDPRPVVRDRAIERLAKLEAAAVKALSAIVRAENEATERARRNAVWALCRMDHGDARRPLREALGDPAAGVRTAAAHALGLARDETAVGPLGRLVQTDSPPVRRKAAEALGRIGRAEAVPQILAGLRAGDDRFLEHALIYALIRINSRSATIAALSDGSRLVRRGGLIALDQMKDGELAAQDVAPLLDADDADLRRTAVEVVSRHPGWSALIHAPLRRWLGAAEQSPGQARALADALIASAHDTAIRGIVAEAINERQTSLATRLLLLGVIREWRLDPFPSEWVEPLGRCLTEPSVCHEALATVKALRLTQLDGQLAGLARRDELGVDLRIAALECLGGRQGALAAGDFTLLRDHLADSVDPLVRLGAARALGASRLTTDQLVDLAATAERCGSLVLRLLLPVFARANDAPIGMALVAGLERSAAAEALSPAELDQTLKPYGAVVNERAESLRVRLVARQRARGEALARLGGELAPLAGNPDRGQEVFLSTKAGCYGCHRAVGRGGSVGPDLSRIGQIRSRAELLESIVIPGRTIAPEYRGYQVATRDGRTLTGLIVRDAPDAIVVRTSDLAEVRIPRGEVEDMTPSTSSLMPEGLETILSRQELCDLLEFLIQQR